jgi:transposase
MKQINFLAEDQRLARLSEMGDPLEKVTEAVDWEEFRSELNKTPKEEMRGLGGRPPYDRVMMFKIVMLQQWYEIADDRAEYLINDRLSFQRFLGFRLGDKVPDAKTIWLLKERLREQGTDRRLFGMFRRQMEELGVIIRSGSIVDATFVDAPRQRNTREENQWALHNACGDAESAQNCGFHSDGIALRSANAGPGELLARR